VTGRLENSLGDHRGPRATLASMPGHCPVEKPRGRAWRKREKTIGGRGGPGGPNFFFLFGPDLRGVRLGRRIMASAGAEGDCRPRLVFAEWVARAIGALERRRLRTFHSTRPPTDRARHCLWPENWPIRIGRWRLRTNFDYGSAAGDRAFGMWAERRDFSDEEAYFDTRGKGVGRVLMAQNSGRRPLHCRRHSCFAGGAGGGKTKKNWGGFPRANWRWLLTQWSICRRTLCGRFRDSGRRPHMGARRMYIQEEKRQSLARREDTPSSGGKRAVVDGFVWHF